MGDYWEVGDRAFAYWEEDDYYYPATITEITDEDIRVRFDDSDEEEWTNSDYLVEYSLEVGDAAEVFFAEDGEYYPAEVKKVKGEEILVLYDDDGTEEWTTLANVRTWYEEDGEEYEEE